jgi:hypothetical protein
MRSPFKALKRWHARRNPTGRASHTEHRVAPRRVSATRLLSLAPAGSGGNIAIAPSGQSLRMVRVDDPQLALAGGGSLAAARERRVIREPYRQAFGRARTEALGRPAGWIVAMSAVEKVFFPVTLLILAILRAWEPLAITVAVETVICMFALGVVMKGRRLEYVAKALLVTPLRYALLASELITLARFATDLWITKNRSWRK